MVLPLILGFCLALALSALFSAAEFALFSISDARVRTLVDAGFRGSGSLLRLRTAPDRLFLLLRLGNTTSDVAAAGLGVLAGLQLWGGAGFLLAVVVAGVLVFVVGELLPRILSARYSVRMALLVAPVFLGTVRVLGPLLAVIEWVPASAPEPLMTNGPETDDEIRQLTELGRSEGVIEEHEGLLIERAIRLDETKVWEIMTPRVDIFAWQDALPLQEIASQFGTVPYSRVPVYGESIDEVTGVLYLRDAYQALITGQRDVTLRDLARQPLIVPGSLSLTRLLRDFQQRRIHLALVVDEYGGTDGLVTLEDVIEELVGEIVDETDVAEETLTRISRTEVVADGDTDLREINHIFNTSFPLLEHRSLNGYLLEELGHVPAEGETIEREGVRIEVTEATETQVLRARLRRLSPPTEAGGWTLPEAERPAAAPGVVGDTADPAADSGEGGPERTDNG